MTSRENDYLKKKETKTKIIHVKQRRSERSFLTPPGDADEVKMTKRKGKEEQ